MTEGVDLGISILPELYDGLLALTVASTPHDAWASAISNATGNLRYIGYPHGKIAAMSSGKRKTTQPSMPRHGSD